MDPRCCICLETDVAELVPVSCQVATRRKTAHEMMQALVSTHIGTLPVRRSVELDATLCDGCLGRLDQAYSMWIACSEAILGLKMKENCSRCCICRTTDASQLVPARSVCTTWDVTISCMYHFMTAVELQDGVDFALYVCRSCLDDLDEAYEFKSKLLKSDCEVITCLLKPWQKMDFEDGSPARLVVDMFAEIVVEPGCTMQQCSVCGLEVETSQLAEKCGGCQLKIKDFKPETMVAEEEETSLGDNDYYDDAAGDVSDIEIKYDIIESFSSDESESESVPARKIRRTNKDNPKKSKPTPKNRICERQAIEKLFDVVLASPDGPFLEVRRKGPVCCGCMEFFLNEDEYHEHMKRDHPKQEDQQEPHVCKVCHFSFETAFHLEMHKRRLMTKVYFYCTACKVLLFSRSIFKQHKILKHTSEQNETEAEGRYAIENEVRYECCVKGCNVMRSSKEMLDKHLDATHKPRPEEPNMCQYCARTFKYRSDYELHVERRSDRPKYVCRIDDCTYESNRKRTIVSHCTARQHIKPIRVGMKSARRANMSAPDLKHFVVVETIGDRLDVMKCTAVACCNCTLFFDTQDALRKHVEDAHAVKDSLPFRCQACNKGFSKQLVLVRHNNEHKEKRYYYCRPCKAFIWDFRLVDHHNVDAHAKEDSVADDRFEQTTSVYQICCGCDKQFETEQELADHRKREHLGVKQVPKLLKRRTCEHCHKRFRSVRKLEEHIEQYEEKAVYKCKKGDCTFESMSRVAIVKHVGGKTHFDSSGRKKYQRTARSQAQPKRTVKIACCVCGVQQASEDEVIEHAKRDHEDKIALSAQKYKDLPHKCPVCYRGFKTAAKLLYHRSHLMRHCKNCQKQFGLTELEAHLVECNKASVTMCDLCGMEFANQRTLELHNLLKHQQGSVLQVCPVCGKSLSQSGMRAHLAAHENKRLWKCEQCPLSFNYKAIFDRHQLIHTGEKQYQCRYGCSNRYRAPGDRVRHENQKHLGKLPFACQLCPEKFVRERDLRLHERKHTGLRLYPCATECRTDTETDIDRRIQPNRQHCSV
ncbi:hypothetical protein quinque_011593 [Culex quinquefasciatus]